MTLWRFCGDAGNQPIGATYASRSVVGSSRAVRHRRRGLHGREV